MSESIKSGAMRRFFIDYLVNTLIGMDVFADRSVKTAGCSGLDSDLAVDSGTFTAGLARSGWGVGLLREPK